MGRNRKLWLKADLPESMSASCCASCDRSVRGSCDSGISNCVHCDVSCSEAAVEKSFVGGDSRCRPSVGSRVLGMFMGFAVTELVVGLGVVDLEVGLVVGIGV